MSIGDGIALLAVWGTVIAAMCSPKVTGLGLVLSVIAAVISTAIIVAL